MSILSLIMSAIHLAYIILCYPLYSYNIGTLPLHYIHYLLPHYLLLLHSFSFHILALSPLTLVFLDYLNLLHTPLNYSVHSRFIIRPLPLHRNNLITLPIMSIHTPFRFAIHLVYIILLYLSYLYNIGTLPLHYIHYLLLHYLLLLHSFNYYILVLSPLILVCLAHSNLYLSHVNYSTHSRFTFHPLILRTLYTPSLLILLSLNIYLNSIILLFNFIMNILLLIIMSLYRNYTLLIMHIIHPLLPLPILFLMSDILMFTILLTLSPVAPYLILTLLLLLLLHFIMHLYTLHIPLSLNLLYYIIFSYLIINLMSFMYHMPPSYSNSLHHN